MINQILLLYTIVLQNKKICISLLFFSLHFLCILHNHDIQNLIHHFNRVVRFRTHKILCFTENWLWNTIQTRIQTTLKQQKNSKKSTMPTQSSPMRPNARSTMNMAPWGSTCPTSLEKRVSNTTSSCRSGGSRWELISL